MNTPRVDILDAWVLLWEPQDHGGAGWLLGMLWMVADFMLLPSHMHFCCC
jgi:hypothetical protein